MIKRVNHFMFLKSHLISESTCSECTLMLHIKGSINIHDSDVATKREFNLVRDISKFDVGN